MKLKKNNSFLKIEISFLGTAFFSGSVGKGETNKILI